MSSRFLAVLLLAAVVSMPGCRMVKMKLGLGETVTNPDPGTPERVIQDVLRAASNPDPDAGWAAFEGLLHSDETSSNRALQEWRQTKFDTIRRKVSGLIEDPATHSYKMMDYREVSGGVQIFVKNESSEVPTPCRLKPDPAVRGAWRVFNACF